MAVVHYYIFIVFIQMCLIRTMTVSCFITHSSAKSQVLVDYCQFHWTFTTFQSVLPMLPRMAKIDIGNLGLDDFEYLENPFFLIPGTREKVVWIHGVPLYFCASFLSLITARIIAGLDYDAPKINHSVVFCLDLHACKHCNWMMFMFFCALEAWQMLVCSDLKHCCDPTFTYRAHDRTITSAVYSSLAKYLVTAGMDAEGKLALWLSLPLEAPSWFNSFLPELLLETK